jgi:hypothetical protein
LGSSCRIAAKEMANDTKWVTMLSERLYGKIMGSVSARGDPPPTFDLAQWVSRLCAPPDGVCDAWRGAASASVYPCV